MENKFDCGVDSFQVECILHSFYSNITYWLSGSCDKSFNINCLTSQVVVSDYYIRELIDKLNILMTEKDLNKMNLCKFSGDTKKYKSNGLYYDLYNIFGAVREILNFGMATDNLSDELYRCYYKEHTIKEVIDFLNEVLNGEYETFEILEDEGIAVEIY